MRHGSTPKWLLVRLAVSIFLIEAGLMTTLHAFGRVPTWFEVLADASLLVLLLIPALHIFVFRPLTQKIRDQADAEARLREANVALRREIDDRKAAETKIALERENLLGILSAMEDGACIVDGDFAIHYVNPAFLRMLGPVGGRTCYAYFHDRTEPCPWCPNERVFAGETVKWQFHFQNADRTFDLLDTPIRMADGRLAKVEFLHDVTEYLRVQNALRASESRYRALMEQASEAILVLDGAARILEINTCGCQLLGRRREELLGRSLLEFIAPEDLALVPFRLTEVLSGRELRVDRRMVRGNGGRVSVETSAKLLDDGRIQVMARDITLRKRQEEDLRRSREILRSLSSHIEAAREQERRRIAREIHDELGQSLTALKMDVVWLASELPQGTGVFEKMSALIETTIVQTQRLCRELRPPVLDDLGLGSAIEWQAREFEERTGIAVSVTLEPGLVEPNGDISTALFRILQEALTNVARHADADVVEVVLRSRAGEMELTVHDNGRGITPREIGDPASLGLLGMRERVHGWNGAFEIRGAPERGTTLTVMIPRPHVGARA